MRLQRNIAIIRSLLVSALANNQHELTLRLTGLLLLQYAEYVQVLERDNAKLEFRERRQFKRVA